MEGLELVVHFPTLNIDILILYLRNYSLGLCNGLLSYSIVLLRVHNLQLKVRLLLLMCTIVPISKDNLIIELVFYF